MFDCISGRIICWRSLNFSNILCRTFAAEAPRKDRDLMKFSYISVFLHMLEKVGHPSKIISRYGRPLNNRLPWRSSQLSYAIWRLSRLQHFSTTIQNALYCTYSVIVKIVSLRQRCIFIFMRQMAVLLQGVDLHINKYAPSNRNWFEFSIGSLCPWPLGFLSEHADISYTT